MSDLISRQAVLEYIASWLEMNSYYHPYSKGESIPTSEIKDIVNSVPSVENKGEWISMYDRWGDIVTTVCGYECSKCGEWNADNDNFCPNCGADMRGKSENDEKDFPQTEDIEPTVKGFADTMDILDRIIGKAESEDKD